MEMCADIFVCGRVCDLEKRITRTRGGGGDSRYIVGRELRTSPSGIGNSSYELPEDLQGCDEAALPLSHTKLLVRGGT